ncbi:MAG TPA: MaoC family dehydratase [Vicinamibacterales bacterium]|nr:MaoC family dehydratase [Vicinamibacterales bacterium]
MTVDRLTEIIGQEMVSPWRDVTQEHVTAFAEITGDRQWIHVDADRAARESPFGGTVAHGFLTLALASRLLRDAVGAIEGARLGVNYGLNKVRFPAPLPSGSRVRGRCTLLSADAVDGGVQATWRIVVERDGSLKPCCAAEWLVRYSV